MNRKILTLTIVVGLIACNKTQNTSENVAQQNDTTISQMQIDFIKTFEGKINDSYDIVLKITSNGGQVTGNYFYNSKGVDIQVDGILDDKGNLTLNEYDSKGNQTGVFNGIISNNSKIEGIWSKPNGDKEMPFLLIESNNEYETSKTQEIEEVSDDISGQYDFEFNSEGVSYGSVKIVSLGNKKFSFEISTSNSKGCTGEISGSGTIGSDNGIGKYSDEDCKSLIFKFTSEKLTIEENDCELHGMGCYFAGEYLKTK